MNIFALDDDPAIAARYHVDKHVVNMPRESCQMLSTAVRLSRSASDIAEFESRTGLYLHKIAFPNHPCTIWARESMENWLWLQELALCLLDEHRFRYGLERTAYRALIRDMLKPKLPRSGKTPYALAVPDWLKEARLGGVLTYKVFYCNNKTHLFKWKNRRPPPWIPYNLLSNELKLKRSLGAKFPGGFHVA